MNRVPEVLIVAEIGGRVGWGHIARGSLLRSILSAEFPVTLKVVNRETWNDDTLERKYTLNSPIDADIVFFDGLSLRSDVAPLINAPIKVSLSYVSDINTVVDWVIAPALHGMDATSNCVTELSAILCNQPVAAKTQEKKSFDTGEALVGVCMGGGDVDCITHIIDAALNTAGYKTRLYTPKNNKGLPLTDFLRRKLEGKDPDTFPYYDMSDCDIVVCQGGLSAIEFALLGIPTVIRRRPDFANAYRFLETLGCSLPSRKDDIPALIDAVSLLVSDSELRARMSCARQVLQTQMNEGFWLPFVNRMTGWGRE